MARSHGEAELRRAVGEFDAKVEMIRKDMQAINEVLKQSGTENHRILQKLDKTENKLGPLP